MSRHYLSIADNRRWSTGWDRSRGDRILQNPPRSPGFHTRPQARWPTVDHFSCIATPALQWCYH